MTAREYHEKLAHQIEVLARLRLGPIAKYHWETTGGRRLAPVIEQLKHNWGFRILGNGRTEVNEEEPERCGPYYLEFRRQKPTRMKISEAMKQAYYATEHWDLIRRERIRVDNRRCVLCSSQDELQVHHVRYELFNEDITDLMTVCSLCHEKIHENCRMRFPAGIALDLVPRLGFEIEFPDWVMP